MNNLYVITSGLSNPSGSNIAAVVANTVRLVIAVDFECEGELLFLT